MLAVVLVVPIVLLLLLLLAAPEVPEMSMMGVVIRHTSYVRGGRVDIRSGSSSHTVGGYDGGGSDCQDGVEEITQRGAHSSWGERLIEWGRGRGRC